MARSLRTSVIEAPDCASYWPSHDLTAGVFSTNVWADSTDAKVSCDSTIQVSGTPDIALRAIKFAGYLARATPRATPAPTFSCSDPAPGLMVCLIIRSTCGGADVCAAAPAAASRNSRGFIRFYRGSNRPIRVYILHSAV